jgi:hypothetical protein
MNWLTSKTERSQMNSRITHHGESVARMTTDVKYHHKKQMENHRRHHSHLRSIPSELASNTNRVHLG